MPSWDYYLRLMVMADKEAIVTALDVTGTATRFSTSLTLGQTRKAISVYNNSNDNSGELYYGFSAALTPGSSSMPIPKGAHMSIPIASGETTPLYFIADSGERGDLRVEEYA